MKTVENLNKENFWDDLEKRYPTAFAHFSKWLDEYKEEIDWDTLFGNKIYGKPVSLIEGNKPDLQMAESFTVRTPGIKFHDIPLEMQNGIIARYELELFNNAEGKGKESYRLIASEYKVHVNNIFEDVERNILKTKSDA